MGDALDEVIDMLPPATIKLRHTDRELKRKEIEVKSKTAENRSYLLKLKKQLEVLNALKEPKDNSQSMKAYEVKIGELEAQIKDLTGAYGDVDLGQLFSEVEELNQQVEEHRKKITEARSQYQCYDGFPADIEQGREVIAEMKESIRKQELAAEALL